MPEATGAWPQPKPLAIRRAGVVVGSAAPFHPEGAAGDGGAVFRAEDERVRSGLRELPELARRELEDHGAALQAGRGRDTVEQGGDARARRGVDLGADDGVEPRDVGPEDLLDRGRGRFGLQVEEQEAPVPVAEGRDVRVGLLPVEGGETAGLGLAQDRAGRKAGRDVGPDRTRGVDDEQRLREELREFVPEALDIEPRGESLHLLRPVREEAAPGVDGREVALDQREHPVSFEAPRAHRNRGDRPDRMRRDEPGDRGRGALVDDRRVVRDPLVERNRLGRDGGHEQRREHGGRPRAPAERRGRESPVERDRRRADRGEDDDRPEARHDAEGGKERQQPVVAEQVDGVLRGRDYVVEVVPERYHGAEREQEEEPRRGEHPAQEGGSVRFAPRPDHASVFVKCEHQCLF